MTAWWLVVLAATPWSTLGEAQRADVVAQVQALPTLRERVLEATEHFVGTPYVLSPLGEGEGRDPDPLFRWDAVDCVTLVEQSLALSLVPPSSVVERLTALRYDGPARWENRLHVMESQWLPVNVRRGLLRDVTGQWGGAATRKVRKTVTAETWRQKVGASLGLPSDKQAIGSFEFDLIPSADAARLLARAPGGLLIVVFRADRPQSVTRVSHIGVLVQGPRGPMLRHASRSFKKVVDEPLARYLARNLDFGAWTIEGLAVFEPVLPPG